MWLPSLPFSSGIPENCRLCFSFLTGQSLTAWPTLPTALCGARRPPWTSQLSSCHLWSDDWSPLWWLVTLEHSYHLPKPLSFAGLYFCSHTLKMVIPPSGVFGPMASLLPPYCRLSLGAAPSSLSPSARSPSSSPDASAWVTFHLNAVHLLPQGKGHETWVLPSGSLKFS